MIKMPANALKKSSTKPARKRAAKKRKLNRYFTVKNSVKVVQDRSGPKANRRAKYMMDILVKHLHAFFNEARPTLDEWDYGINFLTRTGKICNEWRQEFILLSDVLGASMLVETLNHGKFSGETESTVLGPFYVAGAPRYEYGANICLDGKGELVWVSGRVTDNKGRPVAGATLDVWQANEDGFYDVQQKGIQPAMNLRGVFRSDRNGRWGFRTAYPRHYPIPYDGPVGDLLQALDRNPNRPAHLHFMISAAGYEKLTTHIFTHDCPWLQDDAVFGVKKSLIANFEMIDNPTLAAKLGLPNPFRQAEWHVVLSRAKRRIKSV